MMPNRKTIVTILGTRPEAIKMAPVIRELERHPLRFRSLVVTTQQHRELLHQAMVAFNLQSDRDLDLMEAGQQLGDFAARSLKAVSDALRELRPDMVLVQGDTTTAVTAALAAFYQRILVGHVEAGLRSFDRVNPFPEEINRRMAAVLADLHFAPTETSKKNLLAMGIGPHEIFVTGNTIVDALHSVRPGLAYDDRAVGETAALPGRLILVTAHRRENHGVRMHSICLALLALVRCYDDLHIVWPVHPNPLVQSVVAEVLSDEPRIHLVRPTTYGDMIRLMKRCDLIMSDSGGIQEEAPAMHKPLLILREVTERPEVVEVGAARLVGTGVESILEEVDALFTDKAAYDRMRSAPNPFGDGHAARRVVAAISKRLHEADYVDYASDPVPVLRAPRISGESTTWVG
jgi:UDP-N-acetylglucosamine 2-epimerase (non-hydrolysing)